MPDKSVSRRLNIVMLLYPRPYIKPNPHRQCDDLNEGLSTDGYWGNAFWDQEVWQVDRASVTDRIRPLNPRSMAGNCNHPNRDPSPSRARLLAGHVIRVRLGEPAVHATGAPGKRTDCYLTA